MFTAVHLPSTPPHLPMCHGLKHQARRKPQYVRVEHVDFNLGRKFGLLVCFDVEFLEPARQLLQLQASALPTLQQLPRVMFPRSTLSSCPCFGSTLRRSRGVLPASLSPMSALSFCAVTVSGRHHVPAGVVAYIQLHGSLVPFHTFRSETVH
jgi:hypothetical protein